MIVDLHSAALLRLLVCIRSIVCMTRLSLHSHSWLLHCPEESVGADGAPNSISFDVFGSRALERYISDLTLLQSASRNDDGLQNPYVALLRQGTAAI
ncbi:hypothetical protein LINPERHAP1_LOCUS12701 [Linum perenne]